jgi:hypothetical protein
VSGQPDPLVGWRVWSVHDGRLQSLVVPHTWQPGVNQATCLSEARQPCSSPPGRFCQCGFWALWSPDLCIRRARAYPRSHLDHVMGLVAGWGSVAVHGSEGFRAERARALCLFSDWPWDGRMRMLAASAVAKWLVRRVRPLGQALASRHDESARRSVLAPVASQFGVPLLSMEEALRRGVLAEMGVARPVLRRLEDEFASLRTG